MTHIWIDIVLIDRQVIYIILQIRVIYTLENYAITVVASDQDI